LRARRRDSSWSRKRCRKRFRRSFGLSLNGARELGQGRSGFNRWRSQVARRERFCMFLAYSCLNSLHVETRGHWFAFRHKVCESEYRAFSDETTFSPAHSDHSGRFDQQHATGAASKIGRRTNLCLSRSSSRSEEHTSELQSPCNLV